jgi:hypothetical protein
MLEIYFSTTSIIFMVRIIYVQSGAYSQSSQGVSSEPLALVYCSYDNFVECYHSLGTRNRPMRLGGTGPHPQS